MTTDGRVYPWTDDLGYVWVDSVTFLNDAGEGQCFICGRMTRRLDVCYEGYYCGSTECEEEIRRDLERVNGGPESSC